MFTESLGKKTLDKAIGVAPDKNEVMIGITSFSSFSHLKSSSIYESQVPAYCHIGNLIFEKKYDEAIRYGRKLLKITPESAGVHVGLMDAYFKKRNENSVFFKKSTEHARLAMLYGHNTGYVQSRLAINLEKQNKIFQALQICDIVLSDEFHFSRQGCGNKEDFVRRKAKLQRKINMAIDSEKDVVFSDQEVEYMLKQILFDEERERIIYEKFK
jgi:hypothetical protein